LEDGSPELEESLVKVYITKDFLGIRPSHACTEPGRSACTEPCWSAIRPFL